MQFRYRRDDGNAHAASPSFTVDPLFRRVTGEGKAVGTGRRNDQEVARLVKHTALASGVRGDLSDGERGQKFAEHSLRSGLAWSAEVEKLSAKITRPRLGRMTRRYQPRPLPDGS